MLKLNLTLIGFGAIGQALVKRLHEHPSIQITHLVVRETQCEAVGRALAASEPQIAIYGRVPDDSALVLECAGHGALQAHVLPALQRGVECAVLSVGALADLALAKALEAAAVRGQTKLHLLPGAIGAIDALAAARQEGLSAVTYTGRKPPQGWRGSPAEAILNLDALTEAATFFTGSAREAARLYPKNANVAATVSLAGLGLDATQVQLIADPTVSANIHKVHARGAFGEMQLTMRGNPLAENPKTSALTVLSALRFLHNRAAHVTI